MREKISSERENLVREKNTDLAFCFDLNNMYGKSCYGFRTTDIPTVGDGMQPNFVATNTSSLHILIIETRTFYRGGRRQHYFEL